MKIIRPIAITAANLVSSDVPEDEAVYSAGTTYAKGDLVRGNTTETQHTVYESQADANTGNALTDASKWLLVGATNRFRMFDAIVQAQTTNPDEIEVTFTASSRVDSIALLNLSAGSVQVMVDDPSDGIVYDEEFELVSTDGIVDWYSYFFEPIERRSDLVLTDLPPYAGTEITVTLSSPGNTVAIGELVAGLSRELGEATYGASVGILDFSLKERDTFGNIRVVERAYSKRANFTLYMDAGMTDDVVRILSRYRATPAVYVASETYDSTTIYGYFRDFSVEIAGPNHSVCSLELEGLT